MNTRHTLGTGKELGNGIPYDVALLFSFLAIAFHAGSIIISGRGAVLCSDPYVTGWRPVKYFDDTLVLCEHLHLDGTVFFVIAVFESSFLAFEYWVYPLIFCGVSLLGVILFFSGKYREISVVYKDFLIFKNFVQNRIRTQK
ncbi:hypothetical protein APHAL10511_000466 [Amanita phalloides]|nr:hypothetical protein APHAL10511_000466 [Amanita phalloides]